MGHEMGSTCNTHEEMKNSYKILVGTSKGKRLLGRPKHRWEGHHLNGSYGGGGKKI